VGAITALVGAYATYKKDSAPAALKQTRAPAVQTSPVGRKPATEMTAEMKDAMPLQPASPSIFRSRVQPPSFAIRSSNLTESTDPHSAKELDIQVINTSKEECPELIIMAHILVQSLPSQPLRWLSRNIAQNIKPGDTVHFKAGLTKDWTSDTDVKGYIQFLDASNWPHNAYFCMHGTAFVPCATLSR
jgi:hypothetical protein